MVSFNRRIVRILEETGLVELDVLAAASAVAKEGEQSVRGIASALPSHFGVKGFNVGSFDTADLARPK